MPIIPLSVLDLAPVASGSTEREALLRTVEMARHVESLGFHRFWVAEHHNMQAVASAATDVLISQVATATSSIRVGAGGVMLPNHAPLILAERFATLEAFHPGRIDLGIGRAPGTDQRTSLALRRQDNDVGGMAFVRQLQELVAFFDGSFPEGHPFFGVRAVPGLGLRPPLWLLGSSTFSAQVAALLGQRFSFAYHFAPQQLDPALQLYRERFQPSEDLARPYAMIAATVLCADTEAEARRLARGSVLSFVRLRRGDLGPIASPEEADRYPWTPLDEAMAREIMGSWIVGTPEQVRDGLRALVERTQADELILSGSTHDPVAHRKSYTLIAEVFPGAGLER